MPLVLCKCCDKEFYVKPNWLKIGNGKYCSIKCRGLMQRNGKLVFCYECNKSIYRSLKNLKKSKSKKYFCGLKCSLSWLSKHHRGNNHANWKHGEFVYREIIKRTNIKPFCHLCSEDDKRILVVHHLDKNRRNNNVHNLTWLCYNCHFLTHHHPDIELLLHKKIRYE